jgi:hypothetical protein
VQFKKVFLFGVLAFFLGACGKELTVSREEFESDLTRIGDTQVSESEAKSLADKYRGDFKIVGNGETVTKAEFEKASGGTSFNAFLDLILKARTINTYSAK